MYLIRSYSDMENEINKLKYKLTEYKELILEMKKIIIENSYRYPDDSEGEASSFYDE